MTVYLSEEELQDLSRFRLGSDRSGSDLSVESAGLFEPAALLTYLEAVKPKIHSDRLNVTGSLFVKRYAFLAALTLYSMTVFEKGLNTEPENMSLESDDEDPLWLPSFYFRKLECSVPGENRDEWRDEVLRSLFKNHLSRLVLTVSKEARISKMILWENVGLYIVWMYETLLANKPECVTIEQIQEDYEYVVRKADGSLFGEGLKNPFQSLFREQHSGGARIRQTCCLYYLTSEKRDRCSTCPKHCLT